MVRAAWIAVFLLLASNAAWLALWLGRAEPGADPFFERDACEQKVVELEDEVERLRAQAGPVVPGLTGAGGLEQPPSDGTGPSAAPEQAADGADADNEVAKAEAKAASDARAKAYEASRVRVTAIVEKIMQVKDPALRREGLAELADALRSADDTLVEYSLSALHSLRATEIDRGVFRSQVLDLLESEHGGIRRSALYALHATGAQAGDVRHALAGVTDEDPRVRMHVARVLRLYNGGVFEGEAADALTKLLGDEESHVRRGTVRALYGAPLSADVEKALIAVAENPADRYDAVHYGLSAAKDKSRTTIDALFEYLDDENGKVRQRAHWGLQRSIPDENKLYVARRYANHLDKFVNPKTHREALQLIARFGDASLVPQLDRFADNELVDGKVREMARKAADYLRNK